MQAACEPRHSVELKHAAIHGVAYGAPKTKGDSGLFRAIDMHAGFLTGTGKAKAIKTFGERTVIFAQGDAANEVFYIGKGKVKVAVVSNTGKEAVIAVLGDGDFFGEGCLAGQQLRTATVTTITQCSILRLGRETAAGMLQTEPAFANLMLSYALTRTIRVEEDLVDQLFNSSEKRLARALLLLADFGNGGKPEKVIGKISQETLAEMIGTTRSRVSFFMNKFRRLGFIEYKGTIAVRSSLLNVVLHESELKNFHPNTAPRPVT